MRIMGNLYTDNLIGTVIELSDADDWEGARREWEVVGCEIDETHSATCVCGMEGLCYVYIRKNVQKAQAGSSMELILSSQSMGTRGGGTSGSWFPGEPETPQKRHGKGCGGTPFSMPFLLSH